MKKYLLFLLFVFISFSFKAQNNRKLLRSESFWGLHFDRHSRINDSDLGATLTEEMIDSMLQIARPDYIQVDCKGHPGISSYPTKVGKQAKSYVKDPLSLIRKVTENHNVALYVHYSGVRDEYFSTQNPEKSRYNNAGEPDGQNASLWGSYVDDLLIPQMKELAIDYKIDGAWIDGECWAVLPDYHPIAIEDFKKSTGISEAPISNNDINYKSFLEFNRHKFLSYLKHYTTEIHKTAPDFQICSNFAFTALIPDKIPENIGLDFLSGDNSPSNSLNDANFHIRCMAGRGIPYDLMAWSFTRQGQKTAAQLCQEGASIISMGGGYQVYFKQNADMSFQPNTFSVMKEVADFVLPRRNYCQNIEIVPQVGLFLSNSNWKNNVDVVYQLTDHQRVTGVLDALLDGQHSVEILMTDEIRERMNEYPVLVIPGLDKIEPDILMDLEKYVRNGGKLLIIGADATRHFDPLLGNREMKTTKKLGQSLGYNNSFIRVNDMFRSVVPSEDAQIIANFYLTDDFRFPVNVPTAASIKRYGKGMIAGVYADVWSTYSSTKSPVLRDFLIDIIQKLNSDQIIKIEGSHKVHVVTTKKNDRLLIQLINTSGEHANSNVTGIDEIPSLHNLKVSVDMHTVPKSVVVQPEGIPLKFTTLKNGIEFTLPELKIHNSIEIY